MTVIIYVQTKTDEKPEIMSSHGEKCIKRSGVFFYIFWLDRGRNPQKEGEKGRDRRGYYRMLFFLQSAAGDENALDITEGFELKYIL